MIPKARMVLALFVALCGLGGCGCNLVGCVSALTVHLRALPPAPFTVEVIVPLGSQTSYTYRCDGTVTCYQDPYFPEFTPRSFDVRLTTSTGTRLTSFASVTYTKSQPNGEHCSPTCYIANVTMELP